MKTTDLCGVRAAKRAVKALLCILALLLWVKDAGAQQAAAKSSAETLYLQGERGVPLSYAGRAATVQALTSGQLRPLAAAVGDLDGDGIEDLIAGYGAANGGVLVLHRGNLDAFAPQSELSWQSIAAGRFPSPFLPQARMIELPEAPDFVAVGYFTNSRRADVITGARGSHKLYVLANDGNGGLLAPQSVVLSGALTALGVTRFDATASYDHIVAATNGANGAKLVILEGAASGSAVIATVALPAPATALAFGNVSGERFTDIAAAVGGEVAIVHGSNVHAARIGEGPSNVPAETISLSVTASSLAVGSFLPDRAARQQIAVLGSDGSVHIIARAHLDTRPWSLAEMQARRRALLNHQPDPLAIAPDPSEGWQVAERFPAFVSASTPNAPTMLFRTRISSRGADDLMLLDSNHAQVHVLGHEEAQEASAAGVVGSLPPAVHLTMPMNATRPALAALPMRVNIDGRPGVVLLKQGEASPQVMMPLPDPTFFPNRFDDITPRGTGVTCLNTIGVDGSGDCTLREAIIKANATAGTDTIMLQAGTYTLTLPRTATDHHSSLTGTLEVQDSLNIVGAVDGSGNPASIVQGGATLSSSVDKVFSFNEDIDSFTNATVSISNLVIQNGLNRGDTTILDGWGGAFDFDTGASGNNTLTVTNCNITTNQLTDGEGAGFAVFNTNNGTGSVTVSNSTIQSNTATTTTAGPIGSGGGIFIGTPAAMTLTNSKVLNNSVTFGSGSGQVPVGGAMELVGPSGNAGQTKIHNSTISGNHADGNGGGIYSTLNLLVDTGTVIRNNSSGAQGGGIYNNAFSPDALTLSKVSVTSNTATTGGGGGLASGNTTTPVNVSIQFSRFAGNTGTAGTANIENINSVITATDNWWGTNTPAGTIGNSSGGTTTFDPFIVLSDTASPSTIQLGQSTTLTASFLQDNHGTAVSVSNLDVLLGLPLTFGNPIDGTLSNAEAAIQPVNIASATEAGSTVTITTTIAHGYVPGETVVIAGVGAAGYNGTFTIASTPTTTTFTYTDANTGLANSSGGTASVGAAGTATATFQSTLAGTGHSDATVDSGTATANFTIQKGNTTTTLTSSVNPSVFGQSVTFTATVSPVPPAGPPTTAAPTGTVTFLDGGSPIGTGTVNSGTGIATFTTSALAVGNHTITTSYGGDSNYNGSTGSLTGNPQVVNKANTATTVTSSSDPSVFGQSVTFTATVSAVAPGSGTATGTVTFLDGGSPIGTGTLSGGIATFTTSALAVGNHTITTNYGGDGNFNGSTGSLTGNPQVVNKANTATTVTSSANPSVFGQSVTFTATVSPVAPGSGTPVGTVTFLDGGSPIGTGTLSGGIATFTTSALAVGNHTITTNYGGDGNFNGSTGSLTGNPQVVNKANTATTVTSSVNPSVFGQSVTFTATVSPVAPGSGTPVGTVTFLDGGSPIGTGTLSGGIATFTTSALATGNHTITTNYGGDGNFNGSTGSLTGNPQVVNKADTTTTVTSSLNPSVFGQAVTFTATVSPVAPGAGTPTGTVTFLDGGSPIGTGTLSGGIATFTTSALAVGNHTITTSFGGDGNFNGSTGALTGNPQVVNKADTATAVTSSVNPSVFGQAVTFTATAFAVPPGSGIPVGTVTFLDGGSPIGTGTLSGGIATFTTSALAIGNHTITTNYGGDGNFNGSTGSLTGNPQVVNKADTSTTVTSSQNPQTAGQPVTFTATVSPVAPGSGTPTGTVTFLDGGSPIGTGTLSGGVATFTTSALAPGNHTITTNYGGDGNFNGSTGSLTGNPQVVSQAATTTTVTPSAGTITLGDTVTFTATVTAASGTATGLVTFFDGNTPLGSATLNGVAGNDQASISTSLLSAAGSPHSITAVYQGSGSFAASPLSAPVSETVNARTSTTGVALNPTTVVVGQSSTATVTVTDSGSVPPGTAGTFTTTGAPATGRTGFAAVQFANGLVLAAGGTDANNNVLNTAEIYSVSGGTFSTTGNLNAARTGAVAVLLPNGKVLIAGGSNTGTAVGALNSAELFDPGAGTFTPASQNMTAARFGATATLLNTGKVLLAGGDNSGGLLSSAELYDPAADTFTTTGSLNTARAGASATLLGTGKVLIAGGSSDGTANGALNTAELFDPAGNAGAGTFTPITGANSTLAANRWLPEAALLLSGKVLIAGGENSGGALTSADLYDPVANTFTPSNHSMAQARANGSAVALPNGMVLLAGGTTSQAVDLYDADSDRFDTTGSLQQSDNGLTGVLLNNGDVLVVGLTTSATPQSDAELYAPSFNPLGTVGVTSSEATDAITGACTLVPTTSTASTCTSTITAANVATSPHTITGSYPADAVHSTSSNTASLTVNKADTATTVTSSANPSVFGQSVTFTATVSAVAPGAGTPTGTVTFLDGGSPIGTGTLSGGIATFTTSALAVGNHTITTSYGGDGNFNGSTGSLTGNPQVVNKADTTTTVTSSANPSVFGQAVTFTATVSAVAPGTGTPTGTVTFLDGGSPIGTGTMSGGIATFTTSALAVGNHTITTSYAGDSNFNGSNGALTGNPQVVNKSNTATTVTSSQNPSALGQSVTFTATVSAVAPGSGTPTGTVTFLDGGNSIGTGTLSGGVATLTTSALTAGNHTITTTYPGDGNFSGSTGSLTGNPQVVIAPPAIAKAFNPTTIVPNGVSTLTVTLTDPAANTVAAQGVAFTDNFPANLVIATPNGLTNSCAGTATGTAGSGSLTLSGGTIAVNSSCTVTVNVTSPVGGTYVNTTGLVSSTNGGTGASASATLVVALAPAITKSFGAATIPLNGSTTLTFTVNNPNAGVAFTGLAFTDTLPAGLVVAATPNLTDSCGGTAIGAAGATSVSLAAGTLAAQASCAVSLNVTGATAGVKNNSVTVNAANAGTGNTSTASLTVTTPPVLSKAFGATSIPLGGSTSLSFTVQNSNATQALTGVGFTDTLPAGLVVATPNGLTGSCGSGTISAAAGGTAVSLSGSSLAAGASCTFSVNVTGIAPGQQNNTTGAATSNEGGSGTPASASIAVVAPPAIAKAFNPASILPNGTTALTFTITNPAANTLALAGVAFTDSLPAGLTVASSSSTVCGGTLTTTAPTGIALAGAAVPVNNQCQFSVTVTGVTPGAYTNTTGAVSSTNGGTGNTASANLTVATPPSIAKAFGAPSIGLAGSTSLTFTITNPNALALTGVAFTDPLPAGLTVAAPNGLTGTCGTGTVTAAAGSTSVALTGGTIAASGSCSFSVNVTAVAAGNQVNTTGAVSAANGGTGNTATASINVLAPDLTIAKSHSGNFFQGQTGATYMVTVSNAGQGPTAGTVTVTEVPPAGLTLTALAGTGWTCTVANSSCTRSDALAAGSAYPAIAVTVNVAAAAPSSVINTVTVAGGGELNLANDTASDTTTITAPPDFTLAMAPPTITIRAGQNATYTLTITPVNNAFANPIALTATGLPTKSQFTLTSPVTPGATTATATLAIMTSSGDPFLARNVERRGAPLFATLFPMLGLLLTGLGSLRREWRKGKGGMVLLLLMLVCCGLALNGCASAGNFRNLGTAPGTYPITVTATSGNIQHTASATLVVQP